MTAFNTASISPVQILGEDGQNPAGAGNPLAVALTSGTITASISSISLANSTANIGNVTATINGTVTLGNSTASIGIVTSIVSGSITAAISGSVMLAASTATIGIVTAIVSGAISGNVTSQIDQSSFGITNRVVAGKTQSTSVMAAMTTTTAYSPNQVVGGLITFSNALGTSGSGVLQTVTLNIKNIQTASFLFTPFNANPSNSTWTDHVVAAIASTDVFAARDPVSLSGASNILGTASVYSAPGLGIAMAPGSTTVYGILQAVGTTNVFVSTADIQITVKFLQD